MPPESESEVTANGTTKLPSTERKSKKKKKSKKKRSRVDKDDESTSQSTPHPDNKRQKLNDEAKSCDSKEKPAAAKVEAEECPTTPASAVKKKNKKKKKKDRRIKNPHPENDAEAKEPESKQEAETTQEPVFPFPTDPDDHCESPLQAYAHIQPLLLQLQSQTKSKPSRGLGIYDPYYCNGAIIENLTALGFPSVYNKKEDCYKIWKSSSSYPDFDVFLTNPPYSGEHVERLVQHITSAKMGKRPWFLLMPDWVHKKDYFVNAMKRNQIQPFYLVPKKRYVYLPPKNYRASKKSDVHKKSSPFNSMWYIWGGTREQNDRLMQNYYNTRSCVFPVVDSGAVKEGGKQPLSQACDMARSKSALRDLRRKVKKK